MAAIPISLSRNKPYTPQGGTHPLCVCVLQRLGEDQNLRMMIFYPNLPSASSWRTDGV